MVEVIMRKGCVRYIFASLFCVPKVSILEARKKMFYFTLKDLFVLELTSHIQML